MVTRSLPWQTGRYSSTITLGTILTSHVSDRWVVAMEMSHIVMATDTGDVIARGQGLRDHERAGRELCAGDIWRTDWICLRW